MSKIQAISLRSQWLGEKLRAARLRSGYTMREAAEYIQTDHTTLGRFERGTHKMRRVYVQGLLDFYSITDEGERRMFLRLADDAWRKDWWDGDTSDFEAGFIDFTWLEGRADRILAFEPLVIHGLLQTAEYAESLEQFGYGNEPLFDPKARISQTRLMRQRILASPQPTTLHVVMEEPALYRTVGSHQVHHQQIEHLISQAQQPHIDIQILASKGNWDPGHHGPFTYFQMPDPYPALAYIENLAGRTFLEDQSKVERFRQTYSQLQRLSMSPTESLDFLQCLIKET